VIHLRVNGRPVELDDAVSLVDYLQTLRVDPRTVAVEVDDRILDRAEYATTMLREGSRVEIVRMVGGGLPAEVPLRPWSAAPGSPPQPRPARPRARRRRR
jgi:thiamine biosynthesis protein ThiS